MIDTIINGYLVMWVVFLICCWVPVPIIEVERQYYFADRAKRNKLRRLLIANLVLIAVCIATLPIQVSLIKELWRY